MELGDIISARRKRLGINQDALAQIAQVSIATVKDIERGKGNPSLKTLEKICEVLGLEIKLDVRKTVV
ncbi:MAG: helix-turn-helix transcriptional regulator [Muribaculaceae bacterium]|nr:helix-turn-helix transcriptional regulator [Muribaculaceae bacterium]